MLKLYISIEIIPLSLFALKTTHLYILISRNYLNDVEQILPVRIIEENIFQKDISVNEIMCFSLNLSIYFLN